MISLQVNVKNFQEKRVVTVFGYKIKLTCSATKTGNEEEEEDEDDNEEGDEVDDREGDENDKEAEEGDI